MTVKAALASLALAAFASSAPAQEGEDPPSVAVFDFELIDTSLEGEMMGPQEAETRRLEALGRALRVAYEADAGHRLADVGPVRERARSRNLRECGGCAAGLAQEVGADLAVTGTVQKVSNLILNINVYVTPVGGEGPERAFSADIRGNTDESWRRGLDWLIRNRLDLEP